MLCRLPCGTSPDDLSCPADVAVRASPAPLSGNPCGGEVLFLLIAQSTCASPDAFLTLPNEPRACRSLRATALAGVPMLCPAAVLSSSFRQCASLPTPALSIKSLHSKILIFEITVATVNECHGGTLHGSRVLTSVVATACIR